jgi:hypothetical protein
MNLMNINEHNVIQGIGTIITDQLPTFHVFKKVHTILASKYSTVYHQVSKVMNKKAQFKVAQRRYLNTHFFYSVDEFLMFLNESQSF